MIYSHISDKRIREDVNTFIEDVLVNINNTKNDSKLEKLIDKYVPLPAKYDKFEIEDLLKITEMSFSNDYITKTQYDFYSKLFNDMMNTYMNESSFISTRINELLLNESDVTIKRFANESEAAITLPNGNITYTTNAGKTWETKFVNEADKLDVKAIANQLKEDLPKLNKLFAKLTGINLTFEVTSIKSSSFKVESKQNLVNELGLLGKLFIREIYVDMHVYIVKDSNTVALGAHVNYAQYYAMTGRYLEVPNIIYDIASRKFLIEK